MPELGPGGHSPLMIANPRIFWLENHRTGIAASTTDVLLRGTLFPYEYLPLSALFPLLLLFRRQLPAVQLLSRHTTLLAQLLVVSLGL